MAQGMRPNFIERLHCYRRIGQVISPNKPLPLVNHQMEELPLTKSLGFSLRRRLGKTLEDAHLNQEYMDQYQEMIRASQESFESFEDQEERRHRRVIGRDNFDTMRGGRRRIGRRMQSAVGRRRARSQAIRREKLNSQSLRNHQHHIKQSSIEYITD